LHFGSIVRKCTGVPLGLWAAVISAHWELHWVVVSASEASIAKVLLSGSRADGKTTNTVIVIVVMAAAAIPQTKRGVAESYRFMAYLLIGLLRCPDDSGSNLDDTRSSGSGRYGLLFQRRILDTRDCAFNAHATKLAADGPNASNA